MERNEWLRHQPSEQSLIIYEEREREGERERERERERWRDTLTKDMQTCTPVQLVALLLCYKPVLSRVNNYT
jgi:hypothetical protein